jgi:hypothetical protein
MADEITFTSIQKEIEDIRKTLGDLKTILDQVNKDRCRPLLRRESHGPDAVA